jgi:hypothetical protein
VIQVIHLNPQVLVIQDYHLSLLDLVIQVIHLNPLYLEILEHLLDQ